MQPPRLHYMRFEIRRAGEGGGLRYKEWSLYPRSRWCIASSESGRWWRRVSVGCTGVLPLDDETDASEDDMW